MTGLAMWRMVAVVAAAVLILGAAWIEWGRARDRPGGPSPGCRAARAPAATSAGSGLVVAERGFSRLDEHTFSLGALVENGSGKVAYRTAVTFELLDRAGGDRIWAQRQPVEIPVVGPGRRVAVGVGATVPTVDAAEVGRVELRLGETHWAAPDESNLLFQAHDTRPGLASAEPGSSPWVEFWAARPPARCEGLVERGAALLFRDANGTVVGGDTVEVSRGFCSGGDFPDTFAAQFVPQRAALDRTELSVYCDIDPSG
ncbi:hypothetical protein [Dactylosporangium sp. CA-092794]|uniref:hypothetical protein n=1 Tax=Dactylosporangium sp. CA-092794 TaxID=3239929 RepID=UPI003D92956D